jgi:hypothetical protein
VVVGVRKSVEERRRYRAAVEGCVDGRVGSAEAGVDDWHIDGASSGR